MKKCLSILLAVLLAASLLTGCGASAAPETFEGAYDSMTQDNGWGGDSPAEAPEEGAPLPDPSVPQQKRKLIRNAELSLETKQFDETRTQVLQAAQQYGGYTERSSEYGSADSGDRYAEYTLRIPCDHYDDFLTCAAGAGSLVHKNENVRDVTSEYVDVEARLLSLRTQEKRLLELAEKAETMEDLLTIERHLSEVRYEIESYTVQQRTLDDQVDYSAVRVSIQEVTVYSPVNKSFASEVAEAFAGSWQNFVAGLQNFIIALIYALPVLIAAAVIVAVVLVIVRRTAPARSAKRAKQEANRAKSKPVNGADYNVLYQNNKEDKDEPEKP